MKRCDCVCGLVQDQMRKYIQRNQRGRYYPKRLVPGQDVFKSEYSLGRIAQRGLVGQESCHISIGMMIIYHRCTRRSILFWDSRCHRGACLGLHSLLLWSLLLWTLAYDLAVWNKTGARSVVKAFRFYPRLHRRCLLDALVRRFGIPADPISTPPNGQRPY
jgi:hypothetical protein